MGDSEGVQFPMSFFLSSISIFIICWEFLHLNKVEIHTPRKHQSLKWNLLARSLTTQLYVSVFLSLPSKIPWFQSQVKCPGNACLLQEYPFIQVLKIPPSFPGTWVHCIGTSSFHFTNYIFIELWWAGNSSGQVRVGLTSAINENGLDLKSNVH